MSDDLRQLLTRMRNTHLKYASDLNELAQAGVEIRYRNELGEQTTIQDMIEREYAAADRLQKTIEGMS
jgi:hypothetical protein